LDWGAKIQDASPLNTSLVQSTGAKTAQNKLDFSSCKKYDYFKSFFPFEVKYAFSKLKSSAF